MKLDKFSIVYSSYLTNITNIDTSIIRNKINNRLEILILLTFSFTKMFLLSLLPVRDAIGMNNVYWLKHTTKPPSHTEAYLPKTVLSLRNETLQHDALPISVHRETSASESPPDPRV